MSAALGFFSRQGVLPHSGLAFRVETVTFARSLWAEAIALEAPPEPLPEGAWRRVCHLGAYVTQLGDQTAVRGPELLALQEADVEALYRAVMEVGAEEERFRDARGAVSAGARADVEDPALVAG